MRFAGSGIADQQDIFFSADILASHQLPDQRLVNLDRWNWKAGTVDRMRLLSETAAHDLNHQPRRCLGGKTACRAYFGGPRVCYPRRKREAVYRCIQELAAEVSTRAGKPVITPTAWRVAAKQWLLKNRLIRIQKAGKVSPNFYRKMDHN